MLTWKNLLPLLDDETIDMIRWGRVEVAGDTIILPNNTQISDLTDAEIQILFECHFTGIFGGSIFERAAVDMPPPEIVRVL